MCAFFNLRQNLELSRSCSQAFMSYRELHSTRKLQLGAGTHALEGWFNTDVNPSSPGIFFLDSTKPFPFDNAIFDYIFSEHHLEHLSYREGMFALKECYRTLKPGGKLRIATPDLEALIGLYSFNLTTIQQRYVQFITDRFLPDVHCYNPVFVINNAFRNWGHQFLYDKTTLQQVMEEVGFTDIVSKRPGESDEESFCNIEKHGQFIGDEGINEFETMILEGRRPF